MGKDKNKSDWLLNDDLVNASRKEEAQFLSILLKDKDLLSQVISDGITKEYFRTKQNAYLYELVLAHYGAHKSLLTHAAIDSLLDKQTGVSDEQKTSVKNQWMSVNALESDTEDFAMLRKEIDGRYKQKCALGVLGRTHDELSKATFGQHDIITAAREELASIDTSFEESHCVIQTMEEGMGEVWDHIIDRREHPEKHKGIYTGLKGLDDKLFGIERGKYLVVAGIVSGGKTTLMFNMGFNMAFGGEHVLYVSLEKPAHTLFQRLLAMQALVDVNRISRGGKGEDGVNDYTLNKLEKAKKILKDNGTMSRFKCIEMPQNVTLTSIMHKVDIELKKNPKISVLILDYLGCVKHEGAVYSNRPDLMAAETSRTLQAYGRTNKLLTITAVQIKNASTEKIKAKVKKADSDDAANLVQVGTEDLSDSQKIIADADIGLSIILNSDTPPTKAWVNFTKSREGEAKISPCFDFDGNTGRITDQIFAPGQVVGIDEAVYGHDEVKYDENLFEAAEKTEEEKSSKTPPTVSDIFGDDDDMVDEQGIDNLLFDSSDENKEGSKEGSKEEPKKEKKEKGESKGAGVEKLHDEEWNPDDQLNELGLPE